MYLASQTPNPDVQCHWDLHKTKHLSETLKRHTLEWGQLLLDGEVGEVTKNTLQTNKMIVDGKFFTSYFYIYWADYSLFKVENYWYDLEGTNDLLCCVTKIRVVIKKKIKHIWVQILLKRLRIKPMAAYFWVL